MANLQIDKGIERDPQTLRFARLLKTSPHEAVGWLVAFWGQVWDHFHAGIIPPGKGHEDEDLEAMVAWPRSKKGRLMEALRLERYLLDGGVVAGWEKRYGAYFRELEAKRSRERERRKRIRENDGGDGACVGDRAPHVSHTCGTRVSLDETRRDETMMETKRDETNVGTTAVVSFFHSVISESESRRQSLRLVELHGIAIARERAEWFLRQMVRVPFHVNVLAQHAAIAGLNDGAHLARTVQLVEEGKEYLYRELAALGLAFAPTEANFIWIRVGVDAQQLFQRMMARGVIVRPGGQFGAPEHIRVTIGLPAQNRRFVEVLRTVVGELRGS